MVEAAMRGVHGVAERVFERGASRILSCEPIDRLTRVINGRWVSPPLTSHCLPLSSLLAHRLPN